VAHLEVLGFSTIPRGLRSELLAGPGELVCVGIPDT
jgi:hypothetical protein